MPQFLFFHTIFISQKEYFPHQKSEAGPGSPSVTVELSILKKTGGKETILFLTSTHSVGVSVKPSTRLPHFWPKMISSALNRQWAPTTAFSLVCYLDQANHKSQFLTIKILTHLYLKCSCITSLYCPLQFQGMQVILNFSTKKITH